MTQKILALLLVVGFTALFTSAPVTKSAMAQNIDIAPQPCDAQYWNQMSSRAWLEAEREIMQNQNLIFKPDSVLEYTCFDQFVAINAQEGAKIFTDTSYFSPKPLNSNVLANSLNNVVYNSLGKYRDLNFRHSYLGGRADKMIVAGNNNNSYQNHGDYFIEPTKVTVTGRPDNPITTKQYTCTTMQKIWQTAKCANFIDQNEFSETDGFYPFTAIKGYGVDSSGKAIPSVEGYAEALNSDKRIFPKGLECAGSNLGGTMGSWRIEFSNSKNLGEKTYKFQENVFNTYKDVGDKLKSGVCGAPIYTGVTVVTTDGKDYPDAVCSNPGCSYSVDSSGRSAPSCI